MTPSDFGALAESHSALEDKVDSLVTKLAENTAATAETREAMKGVETNTAELMEWLRAFQGALKLLNMVGSVAKPLGYVAAFVSAALSAWYVFIHKGPNP